MGTKRKNSISKINTNKIVITNPPITLLSSFFQLLELNFSRAAAIDLAGRDVKEAVMVSVTPKVIETPVI